LELIAFALPGPAAAGRLTVAVDAHLATQLVDAGESPLQDSIKLRFGQVESAECALRCGWLLRFAFGIWDDCQLWCGHAPRAY
jgi:hypothetical protein